MDSPTGHRSVFSADERFPIARARSSPSRWRPWVGWDENEPRQPSSAGSGARSRRPAWF